MNSPRSDSTTAKPACFQGVVQMDFLAGHGFGFDDRAGVFLAQNLQDDFAGLRGGAGPVDFGAARFKLAGQGDQVFIQMIDGLPLGFRGGLAGGFPALERALAPVAGGFIAAQRRADELPVRQVAGDLAVARALNSETNVRMGFCTTKPG